ncbi:MAG: PLP-dependent cysteine synthase family protein [Halanaeroarchaeum sp.]
MKKSVLETIGSPLVELDGPEGATVAAKLEGQNPGGSAKDRPALEMIRAAERAGQIEPGDTLVEATSGNTGIGLALVTAARGYDLTIVMGEGMSTERRRLLRAYGANLELVEGDVGAANRRAETIADEAGAFRVSQFSSPDNPAAHYRTTGPEIVDQVGDRTVDAFVAAVGTGGTIAGTSRYLREHYPDPTVVGVEPASNPVLSAGEPAPNDFQGMGPSFVPETLDRDAIDRVEAVALDAAEAECRRLARTDGMLVGQSSGAASVAARRIAEGIAADADDPLVVTVFPDSGERYLSTGLFEANGPAANATDDWVANPDS